MPAPRPVPAETDYLVVGAGLAGISFAEAIVNGCDATVTLVDRNYAPGGHWLHAYPFVRLHQPSRLYGVPSLPFGDERIVGEGPEAGLYERATGHEVCGYFDQVMQRCLLPSGRVTFLPRTEYLGEGRLRALTTGTESLIKVRKRVVDATYLEGAVPALAPPPFEVADGVRCVPPGEVVKLGPPPEGYVVIGASKTAMDTCQWLLEQGVDPERIRWVRPRDLWLLNRRHYQGGRHVLSALEATTIQLEAAAAGNPDDFFAHCGDAGLFLRVDKRVTPTMMRGASSDAAELALLGQIEQVIRLGHVTRIEADRIVLSRGEVPTSKGWLHVHCASEGVPTRPPRAIFAPDRITMQHVRIGSPSFSYSLIGLLEASGRDDVEKNRLAPPNAFIRTLRDWVRSTLQSFGGGTRWNKEPDIAAWLEGRLNINQGLSEAFKTPDGKRERERFSRAIGPGLEGMQRMLHDATPEERALFWPPPAEAAQ